MKFHQTLSKNHRKELKKNKFLQNLPKNAKKFDENFLKYSGLSGAKACKSCRARQELSNEYFLANLASIQKRTSPIKFAHLAEKSENGSISNLSIKVTAGPWARWTRTTSKWAAITAATADIRKAFECTLGISAAYRALAFTFAADPSVEPGSIGEGSNHSNYSNHSNSFKIGNFRNFSLENSKHSEKFNIF